MQVGQGHLPGGGYCGKGGRTHTCQGSGGAAEEWPGREGRSGDRYPQHLGLQPSSGRGVAGVQGGGQLSELQASEFRLGNRKDRPSPSPPESSLSACTSPPDPGGGGRAEAMPV